MLSLILPYWQRQAAADRALALLDEHYCELGIELLVIDDGNAEPFEPIETALPVRVVRLPQKSGPKSPVTCWNVGVREARYDVVGLSCIEVLHQRPVLEEMAATLAALGPQGYVLAAAWCPEQHDWHCHSTKPVPTCPPGTGLAFLGLLHRSLYWAAGGYDELYRDGAGYEDRDFIWRLHRAGARFVIRDDLAVIHPKTDATIRWRPEAFGRNEALYRSRWMQ